MVSGGGIGISLKERIRQLRSDHGLPLDDGEEHAMQPGGQQKAPCHLTPIPMSLLEKL